MITMSVHSTILDVHDTDRVMTVFIYEEVGTDLGECTPICFLISKFGLSIGRSRILWLSVCGCILRLFVYCWCFGSVCQVS